MNQGNGRLLNVTSDMMGSSHCCPGTYVNRSLATPGLDSVPGSTGRVLLWRTLLSPLQPCGSPSLTHSPHPHSVSVHYSEVGGFDCFHYCAVLWAFGGEEDPEKPPGRKPWKTERQMPSCVSTMQMCQEEQKKKMLLKASVSFSVL